MRSWIFDARTENSVFRDWDLHGHGSRELENDDDGDDDDDDDDDDA